jgi:hypothetical protein
MPAIADDACLVVQQAGEIATRMRQAGNEACADRVRHVDEHDRNRAGFSLHGGGDLSGMCKEHVGL